MKSSALNVQYLDLSFHPQIIFVKSQAMFKIKYKDYFGFHFAYFDFLPLKDVTYPALKELTQISYLTNSFINRLPVKNPKYVDIPLKY